MTVRAAGGVVVRPASRPRKRRSGGPRSLELALVHRPRYDDWTFPKGKREGKETDEATALREVEEETGFRCRLGTELGTVHYRDARGRDKVVRYWVMELLDGATGSTFAPNPEVDRLRWCTSEDAAGLLSYEHDRVLLDRLEQLSRHRRQSRSRRFGFWRKRGTA
jgi:8-oxo-dGTP diphosphatase